MLKTERLEVGQMKANCYLVYEENSRKALILDPGDDADYIMRRVRDLELVPVYSAATHGHFDHILAAEEIRLAYNIPFAIHRKDEFLVKNAVSSAKHFLSYKDAIAPLVVENLANEFHIDNIKLQVIESPGHTPGSVSFYSEVSEMIFVGDLVFENGAVGRTDFKYSNVMKLTKSLEKLLSLPEKTRVFSGHGRPTTIKALKLYF